MLCGSGTEGRGECIGQGRGGSVQPAGDNVFETGFYKAALERKSRHVAIRGQEQK